MGDWPGPPCPHTTCGCEVPCAKFSAWIDRKLRPPLTGYLKVVLPIRGCGNP